MVFFLNLDGTMTKADNERVFQGSNGVAKISVVAPFNPSNGTALNIAFSLPNGTHTNYVPMASQEYDAATGMGLWTYKLTNSITQYAGTVGVIINVTSTVALPPNGSYTYKGVKATYADLPTSGAAIGDYWKVTAAYDTYNAGSCFYWNGSAWSYLTPDNISTNATSFACNITVEQSVLPSVPSATPTDYDDLYDLLVAYYSQNTGNINIITNNVETLDGRMTAAEGDIRALEETSGTLDERIDIIEADCLRKDGSVAMDANYSPNTEQGIATKKYADDAEADAKAYADQKLSLKQNTLTFDNSPTNGSTNPVQSNGVYAADAALQAQITANAGGIGTLGSRVLTAEGEIDELQSDVDTLEGVTPAGEGTAGQVLQSAGSGNRPIWKSLGTVYTYKGSVEKYAYLPAFGLTTGDTYNVVAAYGDYPPGTNFAWTGSDWDALGGSIDTSIFLTKDGSVAMDNGYTPDADQKIATKKYVDDEAVAAVSNAEDYADQAEADAKAYADSGLALKQDTLTEGDGINIDNGVISSYASYSIRETINDAVSVKQDVLTAGSGITIENTGVPVPITVGDTLNVLYFDTTVAPNFSLFDWDNPDEIVDEYGGNTKIFHLIKDSNGNSVMFAYYAPSVDLYFILCGGTLVYAYSSTSAPYDVELDHFGWQVDSVELSDVPVGYVSKQSSIWGSYISTLEFPHGRGAVINATKPASETFSVAASAWNDLSDGSPFTKQAAITATAAIGADTLVELINDNAIAFGTYGFAIGGVTGQVITIYALSAPSASVTLKIEIGG